MFAVKKQLFNYLSKNQKSDFCKYFESYVKKHAKEKGKDALLQSFLEDEKYYLEINSSRFEWIEEYLDDDIFHKELGLYLNEILKKIEYKEKQKPLLEKQKEYNKLQRKNVQEAKMAKDIPTKAQVSYYKSLCKKKNIAIDEEWLKTASKLDYKNAINELVNKEDEAVDVSDEKQRLLAKLKTIQESKSKADK